jgi:hypothetical protein
VISLSAVHDSRELIAKTLREGEHAARLSTAIIKDPHWQ